MVADARQYLLSKGRRNGSPTEDSSASEANEVAGSHVIAPVSYLPQFNPYSVTNILRFGLVPP